MFLIRSCIRADTFITSKEELQLTLIWPSLTIEGVCRIFISRFKNFICTITTRTIGKINTERSVYCRTDIRFYNIPCILLCRDSGLRHLQIPEIICPDKVNAGFLRRRHGDTSSRSSLSCIKVRTPRRQSICELSVQNQVAVIRINRNLYIGKIKSLRFNPDAIHSVTSKRISSDNQLTVIHTRSNGCPFLTRIRNNRLLYSTQIVRFCTRTIKLIIICYRYYYIISKIVHAWQIKIRCLHNRRINNAKWNIPHAHRSFFLHASQYELKLHASFSVSRKIHCIRFPFQCRL